MKKIFVFALLSCVICVAVFFKTESSPTAAYAAIDEPGYVRTVFNKDNGLPTDEANAVIQTDDGYLWIGSYGGLLRYDGTTFRNFSAEGKIATPSIRVLYQDSKSRLWIGSSDAGVFVYENNEISAVPCTEQYGFLSIRDFIEDDNGVIYVASTSGVCEIRDGKMVPLADLNVKGETIYSLGIDAYNRLWCAMNASKCAVLQDGKCIAVLEADLFFPINDVNRRIVCLASDDKHNIYLGTNGTALAKLSFNGTALDPTGFSSVVYDASDAAYHNRIYVTPDGDIFVSGEQGFAWVKQNGFMMNPRTPSRTDSVNWATIDYEGNVWLASSKEGLVRYAPGCFSTPNYQAGLDNVDVNALTKSNGFYYVATDTGMLAFDENWNPVSNALTKKLENTHVKHVMADRSGRIWCGTYSDFGVVRFDPAVGEITEFNPENGMDSTRVRLCFETASGAIAVGTQDGLALIVGDRVTAFYDKDDGMETQSILCIIQADDGTILAGSAGSGIYAISPDGTIKRYSYDQGLSDGVVLRMVREENGNGGFISAGSSLYYWSNDKFKRLDNLKKGAGSVFDLCEKNGKLWLMQDGGLYSVDKTKLLSGETVNATKYGKGDGLTGSLSVNTWNYIDEDGYLYLSTRKGVSVFDFRDVSAPLPRVVVDSVRIDGAVYERPESLKIGKNNRRITIDFSALTFSGSSNLCLSYQLIGFAKNETVLSDVTSGSVSYTNLAGGTYTFRLCVFDPDEPETKKIVTLTIEKEKKLTEQPLAWVAGVILLGAVCFGIAHLLIRAKMRRLRRTQQAYRSIVAQALKTFANTIDAKDPYTNGHSERVAIYSREIVKRMGYSESDQESVYYIALLHDIGKIGIPDSILNKKGDLTPEERAIVQQHPVKGGEILRDFTALNKIADGARYHHERYDGKGYCEGLSGENIPLIGRIICVADSYDAMSSDRCYRKALPTQKIIEELKNGSGTQFDPKIAEIMIEMINEGVVPVCSGLPEKSDKAGK